MLHFQADQTVFHADLDAHMRRAERRHQLREAIRSRCARCGCHPVHERISRLMLRLVVRFHYWSTPEIRRTVIQPATGTPTVTC
jgi:hypothetical protein